MYDANTSLENSDKENRTEYKTKCIRLYSSIHINYYIAKGVDMTNKIIVNLGFVVLCIFNRSNKNTQLDATINRKIYCFVVQTLLNMFWALPCPSSGAHQTAVAASGFRMNVEVEVLRMEEVVRILYCLFLGMLYLVLVVLEVLTSFRSHQL
jgi:hypothetical protein